MFLSPAIKNIGKGTYGTVDLHFDNHSNIEVVVKTSRNENKNLTEDIVREVSALSVLKGHPNIISLLNVNLLNDPMNIVLDKAESSLDEELKDGRIGGDNRRTQEILYHILRGMKWISDHGIWHRDLKTPNILIMKDGRATIADFGLARGGIFEWTELTNCVFSLWWRPPEILLKKYVSDDAVKDIGTYGPEAETWAIGMCFWQLLAGDNRKAKTYLAGQTEELQLWKVLRALDISPSETKLDWKGGKKDAYKKLRSISDIWDANGEWKGGDVRSKFERRFGHVLQDDTYELLIGCLNLNPKKRISIENALSHSYFRNVRDQIDREFPAPSNFILHTEYPRMQQTVIDDISLQVVVSWLAEVRESYHVDYASLFLSFAIMELFLAKNTTERIRKKHFQLVGIASFSLALLYTGGFLPVDEQVELCDNAYTQDEVIDMSKHIFSLVMSQMHLPTTWTLLKNQTQKLRLTDDVLGELLFFVQMSPIMKGRSYKDIADLTANICIRGVVGEYKDSDLIQEFKALVTGNSPASVKKVFGKVMLKRSSCVKRVKVEQFKKKIN